MIALHGRSSAKLILAAHLDSFFSVWEVAQMSQRGENINKVPCSFDLLANICQKYTVIDAQTHWKMGIFEIKIWQVMFQHNRGHIS